MWPFNAANKEIIESSGNLVEKIGGAFDKNFTSTYERLELRNELVKEANKLISEINNLRSQVILAEETGNKLQRIWRPLMMLSFGFIILSTWFLFPVLNLLLHNQDLNQLIIQLKEADKFWSVVELGLGGYVIGRSVEKIAESVSNNIQINKN